MPLSPGDKLGPYEILSPIGAGGIQPLTRTSRSVFMGPLIGINGSYVVRTLPRCEGNINGKH